MTSTFSVMITVSMTITHSSSSSTNYSLWSGDEKMGKKSGGVKSPVDHYRRQLGKHEKHLATSRSRDAIGVSKSSKHASNPSSLKPKFILKVGFVLVLLLIFIAVIYFIGFMGVIQVLYDAVEVVTAYWRGSSQGAGSKDKSGSL